MIILLQNALKAACDEQAMQVRKAPGQVSLAFNLFTAEMQ